MYLRESLRDYHIFISHAWAYHDEYYRLVNMLDRAPRFCWTNYSVPKHDALDAATDAELVAELRDQIKPTCIVLVVAGMYTAYRKWIQKEIDLAQAMSKPIVGIRPWGAQLVPREVASAAKEMVGWNTDSIVSAIRRWALPRS